MVIAGIVGSSSIVLFLFSNQSSKYSNLNLEGNSSLIEKTKDVPVVKLFLEKFPSAKTSVDQSGKQAVDFRQDLDSNSFPSGDPFIRLRVFLASEGLQEDMFIECWDGKAQHVTRGEENVFDYLSNQETCLQDGK